MQSYVGRVLIADQDLSLLGRLKKAFEQIGFFVDLASDWLTATSKLAITDYDGLVLDCQLSSEPVTQVLPTLVSKNQFMKVILLSSTATVDEAVKTMSLGAACYLSKDCKNLIEQSLEWFSDSPEIKKNSKIEQGVVALIGKSEAIQDVFSEVHKVCNVNATVLLTGESGTGKELFARYIYQKSERVDNPFEAINCGAIPENLLESELFGHKKGSFTDAKSDRKGVFELCSEGVLFLDEIGDMPLNLQVKLLRVLQEKELKPVGGDRSIKVNTRVICATNKDLEKEVAEGRFREDLYFRLSVFPIELPPLRERKVDIPLFVEGFLEHFNTLYNKNVLPPNAQTIDKICSFHWPGNIRQLKNAIERGVVLADQLELKFENMFPRAKSRAEQNEDSIDETNYAQAKINFEKEYLAKLLQKTNGNVSEAARISGRFRSDLYRLLDKYKIDRSRYVKR